MDKFSISLEVRHDELIANPDDAQAIALDLKKKLEDQGFLVMSWTTEAIAQEHQDAYARTVAEVRASG